MHEHGVRRAIEICEKWCEFVVSEVIAFMIRKETSAGSLQVMLSIVRFLYASKPSAHDRPTVDLINTYAAVVYGRGVTAKKENTFGSL
jgi:hypothetical protein